MTPLLTLHFILNFTIATKSGILIIQDGEIPKSTPFEPNPRLHDFFFQSKEKKNLNFIYVKRNVQN